MSFDHTGAGVMKKAMMAVFLLALTFSIAMSSLAYAQEGKPADPAKKATDQQEPKGQGEVTAQGDQYIIGPEDVLLIYVWKEDSLTKTLPVRIDGKISLPLVDDIQAVGLTPLQLKDALTLKLKAFFDNPTVTVTVMEANSYKVYVSGEVKQPGVHRIRSEITLIKLITLVGGFTVWADQKKILIITNEKGVEKRKTVNYKKIVAGEEPDVPINRGDTVIVR
jgi:polysaccharide biosynthesis/export protein